MADWSHNSKFGPMMNYSVKTKLQVYRENVTITTNDFGGWLVVNTGTGTIQVNKITLQPSEGLDFTHLHPTVRWSSPIQIVITEPGGEATLTQLIYKEDKR